MTDHHTGSRNKRKRRDTGKLAAQLAPLEEQDKVAASKQGASEASNQGEGVILVDTPRLPKGIVNDDNRRILGIEPVVLVIVGLLLLFIAFIAWQVSGMPPNPPPS